MYILRIEHQVLDFGIWKQAFDADPAGRQAAGVRRYRIMRATDDTSYVLIDLEFETEEQAEQLLGAMRTVWEQVAGKIILEPQARIVELLEDKEY